jgi:hypothetical protein
MNQREQIAKIILAYGNLVRDLYCNSRLTLQDRIDMEEVGRIAATKSILSLSPKVEPVNREQLIKKWSKYKFGCEGVDPEVMCKNHLKEATSDVDWFLANLPKVEVTEQLNKLHQEMVKNIEETNNILLTKKIKEIKVEVKLPENPFPRTVMPIGWDGYNNALCDIQKLNPDIKFVEAK